MSRLFCVKIYKKDDLFSLIFGLFRKCIQINHLLAKINVIIFYLVLQYELNFVIIKADSER